jgi:hypothetical protein
MGKWPGRERILIACRETSRKKVQDSEHTIILSQIGDVHNRIQLSTVPFPGQPQSRVVSICLNISQRTRISLHPVAWWFFNEAWASGIRVPVVIGEVMKTRMGERATETIATLSLASLEGHDQIERTSGKFAPPHGDNTGTVVADWCAHAPFVRMGREVFDHAR